MSHKTLIIFLLLIFVLLSGCSEKTDNTDLTANETYVVNETTTINNFPNSEFPEEKDKIVPVELYLDDSNGHETEYYDDGSFSDIYSNTAEGYVEKINYNETNELINYEKTVYDEKGRIDCIYVYSTDKTFDYACLREYDSLGRYYRYYYYNSTCALVCYEVVSYDGYGNELSVELYDTKGNLLVEFPDTF